MHPASLHAGFDDVKRVHDQDLRGAVSLKAQLGEGVLKLASETPAMAPAATW